MQHARWAWPGVDAAPGNQATQEMEPRCPLPTCGGGGGGLARDDKGVGAMCLSIGFASSLRYEAGGG